jgi:hypothetical protein
MVVSRCIVETRKNPRNSEKCCFQIRNSWNVFQFFEAKPDLRLQRTFTFVGWLGFAVLGALNVMHDRPHIQIGPGFIGLVGAFVDGLLDATSANDNGVGPRLVSRLTEDPCSVGKGCCQSSKEILSGSRGKRRSRIVSDSIR